LFLRGNRAPVGQLVAFDPGDPATPDDDTVTFEEVGVFVARSKVSFTGESLDAGEIETADVPYDTFPESGPFRYESDISTWKPQPDVVVVDDILSIAAVVGSPILAPFPAAPYDADQAAAIDAVLVVAPFGSVAVDRSAGFGPERPLGFGWLPRTAGPRLGLAGFAATNDPWQLKEFDAAKFALPEGYDNGFQNGRALAGEPGFSEGDILRFTDTTGGQPVITTLSVPAPPSLVANEEGAALDPPLDLTLRVDTVVMDRGAQEFLLLWRVTFPWEDRLKAATLEVS
jgi:hypothetical protein